ncbi:little elongation complex subunit 1 isoform X2 [Alligator mississippiensis]|uniref:little elongation complex subunit 1 isoform X2 n=1 Tax=Alligator mississippiensis TaxID=8496 RepID=UPI0007118B57|nr:little elongation complex subunit 1 isoform X2 [Alligator mississippiensis]
MMPGETPAAAAGTAAEAVTGCANCGALQQNLNEYVAALIALKQKIFDTDRLLTDYQQKCDELQFAERENSTLRNQVEQMLQKISPLEKCQEELGSLKAELEEKKSSLKIYQESHLEYIRVKEEVTKSDAAKKKLEAKVKKLEEAATKHTQDFKQLKSEKKMLEKELKKAQEKLDDCPKQKCKKVLKHAETQSSRDDLVASIDKEKIKQLLEELWVCIDSAAGKRQNQDNDYILASVQGHSRTPEKISKFFRQEVAQTRRKPRKSEKMIPHQSSLETVIEQNSLAATQIKMDESLIDHFESKTTDESLQSCNGDSAFYEDKTIGVVVQTDCEDRSSDFSDEEEHLAGNVKDILNWIRPLPPLLSPMQLSPAVTPDTLFGDFTDSSDEEIDYCAQTVEDILEKSSEEYHVSLKEESNIQEKYEPDHDTETSSKLRVNEETSIYSDLFTAENLLITGRDAEAKQTQMVISSIDTMVNEELLEEKVESMEAEQILAEQTENMEIETGTTVQLVMPTSEVNEEKMIDDEGVQTEDKASSTERVSFNFEHLQENSNGAVQTEKDVVSNTNTVASSEHLQEKSSKLMEVGEDELPRKVDTPELSPIPKDRVPSSPQKSIFAVENECFEEEPNEMESEMVENESKGIKRKPNVVNVVLGLEDHVEQITTGKKVIAEELHVETEDKTQHPEEEDLASNFSNPKSFSGVESDEVWQCNGEETFMKTDIDTEIKDTAIESQFSEEKLSNGERLEELLVQSEEPEVNEDRGLEKASAFISATEVNRNSLSLDEANAIADVGGTAASLPTKKGEGEQLKTVELSTEGNITEVSKNSLSLDEANAIAGGSASSLSTKAGEGEQLTTGLLSTEVNIMNSEQKGFSGNSTNGKNVLEIATFSESCHVECGELLEVQEEGCLQAKLEHNQKDAGILLQKESDFEILPASPNPDCIINGENEALEPKEMDPDKHVIGQTSETKHIENMFGVLEHKLSETIKVFERQEIKMEHLEFKLGYVREKSSQLLETEKIGMANCVVTESEHTSQVQPLKAVHSFSVAENFQCSSISEKLNDKSPEEMVIKNCNNNSTDLEERHGEKMNERGEISDASEQVASEENAEKELALSKEDILLGRNVVTEETNSFSTVKIGSEATAAPAGFTLSLQQNYQDFNTNSTDDSVKDCITQDAASTVARNNEIDYDSSIRFAYNHSLSDVNGKEAVPNDKENECKQLVCPINEYENKNNIQTIKEQLEEPQKPLVTLEVLGASSTDSGNHAKEDTNLVFEGGVHGMSILREVDTHICRTKETSSIHREKPLCSERQMESPVEYPVTEIMIEENDKDLNSLGESSKDGGRTLTETPEFQEEASGSAEEDYPLRKVKYTKHYDSFSVFKEELNTSRTSVEDLSQIHMAVDDHQVFGHSTLHTENNESDKQLKINMLMDIVIPCKTNHSPSMTKEVSHFTGVSESESKLSMIHETMFHSDENTERAPEHGGNTNAVGWACDNEKNSLRDEASEEIPTKPSTLETNLLPHQLLAECSKIYKSVIKNSKLDAALFTSADLLERKDNEELGSNVEQSVPHEAGIETPVPGEELNDKQEETHAAFSLADFNTRASQDAINSGTSLQQTDFQKSKRENISVKSSQNLAMLSAISDPQAEYQNFESQETILENSPALELESSVDLAPQRSSRSNQKAQEPSKSIKDSAKMIDQDSQGKFLQRLSRGKGKRKTLQVQLTQQVLANTDSSTPSRCSPETIYKIRQEMGPPLPPLLLPLKATPPRTVRPASPVMTSASQSSLPSPLDDLISPLRDIPIPPLVSPLADTPKRRSPPRTCTPSPSETTVCRRILSSPLQFCAATPKHALPVPGRLPLSASGSGAPGVPQENSVKILDTMYPELSARARTLNILKGNIQLNRCAPSDSKNLPGPVSQITGFKTIASTSTAFVKTGSSSKPDSNRDQQTDLGNQQPCTSSLNQIGKRTLSTSMPRSAKRLRLDSESPRLETNDKEDVANKGKGDFSSEVQSVMGKTMLLNNFEISQSVGNSSSEMSSSVEKIIDPDSKAVSLALKKISESCFDLFPVIRSHVHVGNISKVPVMRNEEKDIVYEFGVANKHLAELLLHTILNKLKTEKTSLEHSFTHALCRVYIGICRQLGDLERARLFCYSLLKEDFPESEKLILFIVSVWQDIFSFQGVINKAVQLVARQRARGEVLKCLNAYLNWEKESPLDAGIMVSSLLLAIQLCPKLEFQSSDQYGEDLPESTWEYIFAIELLCSHLKWDWTHNNIISKELWPLMHKWIQHRKGHEAVQSIPDIIVASALRLIGRLSQIGLKERFSSAVKNISSVIGVFVQHAKEEGVPWGVQLAAVYALLDLGPSNPVGILEAIQPWRAAATNSIPTAVNSGITELSSLSTAESK